LCQQTLAHPFIAVAGNSVRNFMSEHNGEAGLVLCHRQNSRIDHHLPSRHAPCVDLLALDQIEFPVVSVKLAREPLLTHVALDSGLNIPTDLLYKGGLCGVGADLVLLEKIAVLLSAHREHLG
jgi:hypothetical protein